MWIFIVIKNSNNTLSKIHQKLLLIERLGTFKEVPKALSKNLKFLHKVVSTTYYVIYSLLSVQIERLSHKLHLTLSSWRNTAFLMCYLNDPNT